MGNKEADHAKEIVVAMPIYSLIKDRDHYSKTSGSLWEHSDEPGLDDSGAIIDFPDNTDSTSVKCKQGIAGQTGNNGT